MIILAVFLFAGANAFGARSGGILTSGDPHNLSNLVLADGITETGSSNNSGGAYSIVGVSSFTGYMMFLRNYAYGSGGAISMAAKIGFNFSSVSFIDNSAKGSGGAIFAGIGSLIEFNNSTVSFIRNTTDSGSTGGPITLNSSIITFKSSSASFINNVAGTGAPGGAIYAYGSNSVIEFAKSTANFISNIAIYGGGGALNLSSMKSSFSHSLINFTSNTAYNSSGNGGAIYAFGSPGGGGFASVYGYIDFFDNSRVSFIGNSAVANGGALYFYGYIISNFADSSVSFVRNTAALGGAIYVGNTSNYPANINFTNSTVSFTNNVSLSSGGAIYGASGGIVNFTNSSVSFISNTAEYYGGAFYVSNGAQVIFNDSNVIFKENLVNGELNDIYITSVGATFEVNVASAYKIEMFSGFQAYSGAIINKKGAGLWYLSGFNYINNVSSFGVVGGTLKIAESSFSYIGNSTGIFVGGAQTQFILQASSGYFIGNKASVGNGGAISAQTNSIINFVDSTASFVNNSAYTYGGAISASQSTINFNDSMVSFIENSVSDGGGGAIYASNKSTINFADSSVSFISNSAVNGGAIYDPQSIINFSGSTVSFIENSASNEGGAIYISEQSTINFAKSIANFTSNSAYLGGAIYADNQSTINFTNSSASFTNNTADSGGAIIIENSIINFDSSEVSFISNSAEEWGGAINASYAIIKFVNSTASFIENSAEIGGAIVAAAQSTIDFTDSYASFIDNTALYGGMMYANEAIINFANSTASFTSNSANYGGAIYAYTNSTINFANSTVSFTNNSAVMGGAVIVEYSKMEFKNSVAIFENNIADSIPNDILLHSGLLSLDNSRIDIYSGFMSEDTDNIIRLDNNAVLNILGGYSDEFDGVIEVFKGTVNVNASYIGGNTELNTFESILSLNNGAVLVRGSSVIFNDKDASINVTNDIGSITFHSEFFIVGGDGGNINKTGLGILNINADYSSFEGRFEVSAGTAIVNYNNDDGYGKIFGAINVVRNNSYLHAHGQSINYGRLIIINGASVYNYAGDATKSVLISDGDNRLTLSGADNKVIFTKEQGEIKYTLEDIFVSDENLFRDNEVIFRG